MIKKSVLLLFSLALAFTIAACGPGVTQTKDTEQDESIINEQTNGPDTGNESIVEESMKIESEAPLKEENGVSGENDSADSNELRRALLGYSTTEEPSCVPVILNAIEENTLEFLQIFTDIDNKEQVLMLLGWEISGANKDGNMVYQEAIDGVDDTQLNDQERETLNFIKVNIEAAENH